VMFWTQLNSAFLLASGPFQAMGRQFRSKRGGLDEGELLAIGLTVLMVGIGGWLLSRWLARQEAGKRRSHSRRQLFRTLCAAHELSGHDRRLLRQLARAHRLRDPARVFLEPQRYDPKVLSPALEAKQHELNQLRGRLFGDLSE